MIEARLRTKIPASELEQKKGKIVTDGDYNLLLTRAARLLKPNGQPLAVYLPGAVRDDLDLAYGSLQRVKVQTDNRGLASGTIRAKAGGNRTRSARVHSAILGGIDGPPRAPECRLTHYTRQHMDRWQSIFPLLQAISGQFERHVPERYAAQRDYCDRTEEEWVVPGTVFTTVTVNNSYSTGVHTDKGDLDAGFSTIAVGRKGDWTGGVLVFPEYRVGVSLGHGDLILMDAHEWHGNTAMVCCPEKPLSGPCPACGSERISVVSYYRTKIESCDTPEGEEAKRRARSERRAAAA
jgi:hypothetical protein